MLGNVMIDRRRLIKLAGISAIAPLALPRRAAAQADWPKR
jgi:hypothetical protein